MGRNLQLANAVDHVHERRGEKLTHLLEDLDDRAGRIRKAATNWQETEQAVTKALSKKSGAPWDFRSKISTPVRRKRSTR
ncbi:MAG: hypothetical protein HOU01_21760 [Streptomycetaceae bacterium]|nr:hypothetical protein [Streptomycetaceae bacterium]